MSGLDSDPVYQKLKELVIPAENSFTIASSLHMAREDAEKAIAYLVWEIKISLGKVITLGQQENIESLKSCIEFADSCRRGLNLEDNKAMIEMMVAALEEAEVPAEEG